MIDQSDWYASATGTGPDLPELDKSFDRADSDDAERDHEGHDSAAVGVSR